MKHIEHNSRKTGETYKIGHVFDEDGKTFDVTVYFRYPTQAEYDEADKGATLPDIRLAGWHFGEYDNDIAEMYVDATPQQTIHGRDADDPKLMLFYYTVVNEIDKLGRYYLNQQHTATVSISQSLDKPNELAVHVAALGRTTAKLTALGAIRKIFMDAWQDLNNKGDK